MACTQEEIRKSLQTWLDLYNEMSAAQDRFHALTGAFCDCALLGPTWNLFEAYSRELGARLGDLNDWLSWFLYDNQQGKGENLVVLSTESRTEGFLVRNLDDLAYILATATPNQPKVKQ